MTRVFIADDHPVVREGVRRILQGAAEVEVVGEAARGDEALEAVRKLKPDVLILDIGMPGPSYLEVLAALPAASAGTRALILSAQPEEEYAVRALKGGATGYLTKGYAPPDLVEAVRRIAAGHRYVTRELAEQLALGVVEGAAKAPHETLSNREFEVFRFLAGGLSLKEIGARMGVSPKTVSSFRARVLEKMGVKTNADLVRYAVEHRLV
ncbi:MAG TPA: response regulator transcription factor [Gemmatimonadales bacterium]|nr:response regulator transcription factor [Gemmatimonadales bacterium]